MCQNLLPAEQGVTRRVNSKPKHSKPYGNPFTWQHQTQHVYHISEHEACSFSGSPDLKVHSSVALRIKISAESWQPREKCSRLATAQWLNHAVNFNSVRKQNLVYVRQAHRRLQSWSRRLARAELRTDQRLDSCELPDSAASSSDARSTNEGDEDDCQCGAFIERSQRHA